MPDIAGITLGDLKQFIGNLFSHPRPVPADSFFQTRTTHTPGQVMDVAGINAAYQPNVDPVSRVLASNLPPEIKQKLIDQWKSLGKGTIFAPQSILQNRPDTLQHEQIHALEQKANLQNYNKEIGDRLSPEVSRYLDRDPTYVAEAKQIGRENVRGLEGLAVDLTDRSIPMNAKLRDYVSSLLPPEQKKQLEKLSER